MNTFDAFALGVLQRMESPIVILNAESNIVAANAAGWELLGSSAEAARGKPVEGLLRLTSARVRTPSTARCAHDPSRGWASILQSESRYFPGVALEQKRHQGERLVYNLELATIEESEVQRLADYIFKQHPDWVLDDIPLEDLMALVTPLNHILYFHDITALTNWEISRQECMRSTLDVVVRTLDHYIRNALTPILGYSELMQRKDKVFTPEQTARILDRIAGHVHLITALLDALRTVRDIHVQEPLGADATLINIEKDLQARLEQQTD